ncbi:MAG TPA: hypothetical protein PKE38_14965 [Ignavibacteriaceae bacterium]|nr:hypothetical protein [Ignavibacteriaceae bacterium]
MKKNNLILLLSTFLTLIFYACKSANPIIPIDNIPPGKRDYVWSIDSIDYGNIPSLIQLESIWGSSAVDVWGANGDASDVRDCLWHYDGVKWSRATEGTPITAGNGNKVVYSVWGTAQNNVWAFGRKINFGTLSAFIMHYNGSQWVEATPPNVAALNANLYCVYGTAANNIWVGGYEYALHYNGSNWNTLKVADSIIVGSISGNDQYLYLTTYSPWSDYTPRKLYLFKEGNFLNIDQSPVYPIKFGLGLWARQNELKTFEDGIISTSLKSNGDVDLNGWHRELTTTSAFGLGSIYIQSSKNVFAVGQLYLIYHFDGADWIRININVPNHTVDPLSLFWGVWTDGKEVFISDTENGIIYHGR